MTTNFSDPICELLYYRLKDCIPLGLYKIWFRVKDSFLEGLGDLLGYSDQDFNELVQYSSLSRRNGQLDLESWGQKLHFQIEVRSASIDAMKFSVIRFGNSISVADSPESVIPAETSSNGSSWRAKTYKDTEYMRLYIAEYREKYVGKAVIRHKSRLPLGIEQLIRERKQAKLVDSGRKVSISTSVVRSYLALDDIEEVDVAPHITDYFSNLTDGEREDIFIEDLRRNHLNQFRMDVATVGNNRVSSLFLFPTAYSTVDVDVEGDIPLSPSRFKYYKRKVTQDMVTQLATVIGGTKERGMHILLSHLLDMDDKVVDAVLRSNGKAAFKKLNAEETLALQNEANLSVQQRLLIARFLKYFNGNKAVLTGEKEISKSSWRECGSLTEYQVLVYYVDNEGKEFLEYNQMERNNRVRKELPFFYSCPKDVLSDRLDFFRDRRDSGYKSIGMVLDNDQSKQLPLFLFVTILGDHGGTEMKVCQMMLLRNGDGQKYTTCIGQFEGKETNFLFENTVFPPINTGIEELNNLMVLVVEWKNVGYDYFDYIFYRKQLFLESDNHYQLPALISWIINVNNPNLIDGVRFGDEDYLCFLSLRKKFQLIVMSVMLT